MVTENHSVVQGGYGERVEQLLRERCSLSTRNASASHRPAVVPLLVVHVGGTVTVVVPTLR